MAIIINIDVMLAKRKMSVTELAEKVGITVEDRRETRGPSTAPLVRRVHLGTTVRD